MASFFNSEFRAREPVLEKEIIVLPRVVAVIDSLAWSICNDGEGIIVPMPFYTGFKPAVSERARGVLIPASFQCLEGYRCLDDVFAPEMNRKALENALLQATQSGVKVRAVLLSNPHNPLGRCYPAASLKEIARFCGRNNLHLICDEVFAMSVYHNSQAADLAPFTSILALELDDSIDRHLVHVAYGMGKDFSATGLRLGALHSRNEGLIAAVSSICVFGWVPYITQDMWANILEDEQFRVDFLTKNREVLTKHCTILRSFLDQHGIPYYNSVHAGVFVWVDLRRYLHGKSVQPATSNCSLHKLSSFKTDIYRDREMKLFKRCLASGVGISLGSSFSTEELGWFRISFAVEEEALHIGLQRLIRCLECIEADGWESS
ncbi:putative acc synthase [Camillea tinctor]|nr:putative acc synthase [Camillea tinctor]